MEKSPEYSSNSEFRSISWSEGNNQRKYILGQKITTDIKSDGSRVRGVIWSIDDTSKTIDSIFFKEKYTIKVVSKDGVIYDFFSILHPKNMTLLHNHEELIEL